MQFLMALALRMGRTLGELRQTMTVGEFRMWAEYDRISPIGDIRGDSTFSGQPDDATMLAVDRRNAALERRIINTLTAEVNNPQKKFGRAIYSNLQPKKPR